MVCSAQRRMSGGIIAIAGGFIATGGLLLASIAWPSTWPWGGWLPWDSPQQLLSEWVGVCLLVGAVLLIGGARAAGAALVGSSVCCFLSFPLVKGLFGGDHLETLVHGAVIAGSVGLIGFGLAGLALGAHAPLGRYPVALAALALGTAVIGTLLILGIHAEAAPSCSLQTALPVTNPSSPFAASCFRGFEDPWLQAVLAFNVAFLALLFLVQAWQASRSSGEPDPFVDWLNRRSDRGGPPFLL
jgi:hypothetical protein